MLTTGHKILITVWCALNRIPTSSTCPLRWVIRDSPVDSYALREEKQTEQSLRRTLHNSDFSYELCSDVAPLQARCSCSGMYEAYYNNSYTYVQVVYYKHTCAIVNPYEYDSAEPCIKYAIRSHTMQRCKHSQVFAQETTLPANMPIGCIW